MALGGYLCRSGLGGLPLNLPAWSDSRISICGRNAFGRGLALPAHLESVETRQIDESSNPPKKEDQNLETELANLKAKMKPDSED